MRTCRETRGWLWSEKDGEFADGQLHAAQKRQNPQPRRVGKGLQQVCEWKRIHWECVI